MTELNTPRLLLRQWRDADLDPWAALNADPDVREYFPTVLTRDESAESIARFRDAIEQRGWGLWAVEVRDTGEFIGFTGLDPVDDQYPFSGVEAGWRLARSAWGHGYATEAARAALAYGFDRLELPEILSITAVGNVRSQAVMRRLGMTHDPAEDFDDPDVPPGPLQRSVLFRIQAQNGPTDPSPGSTA
jgi:RimJ/RimL family protein N-acetyltransferase